MTMKKILNISDKELREHKNKKLQNPVKKAMQNTCPEKYPWPCSACMRKAGLTIPCSGR
jgi:hypothetical protein